MLRTLWVIIVAVSVTVPVSIIVTFIALVRSTSPLIDRLIRFWAQTIVNAAGIELKTENLEAIDPKQRYILVSNHYSYFDIPCILAAIPQPIRFMAKVSLFQVPLFGIAIRRAGFIPIDRKNRRTAVKSLELAGERIRKGNTIVIFPEEGRTRERTMKPFQRGAFLLALRSELQVLPIAVDGTYDVFRVGARKVTPGIVSIKAGRPIATAGRSVREKEQVATEAREQIAEMLGMPEPRL
jgi:1-acyl-sn-glycerol-3-phosphate acyltransferase